MINCNLDRSRKKLVRGGKTEEEEEEDEFFSAQGMNENRNRIP